METYCGSRKSNWTHFFKNEPECMEDSDTLVPLRESGMEGGATNVSLRGVLDPARSF